MDYRLLTTDDEIFECAKDFEKKPFVSVDFEGEFNLHCYGEHLCLVQIFSGDEYFIIDPRSQKVTKKGLEAFFSSDVEKLWFDCQSDLALIRKNYELDCKNIYDIRVLALLIEEKGNLTSLVEKYLGIFNEEGENKKKNQQANWMKRPLEPSLIEYALNDVKYLHLLKPILLEEVERKGKSKDIKFFMHKAVSPHKIKPGYTKLANWKRLNIEQRIYMKNFYIARDVVARRFNVPSHHVLDKHKLIGAAKECPKTLDGAFAMFGPLSPRYLPYLKESFSRAFVEIEKEKKNQ